MDEVSVSPRPEVTDRQSKSWLVRATENITVAPKCRLIVMGRLQSEEEQSLPPLVIVQPAQIPIEGILRARRLSRIEASAQEPRGATSQDGHASTRACCAHVMLANFSAETLTIPKATILGVAEVSESVINRINAGSEVDTSRPEKPRMQKRNELLYRKLNHLTQEQRQQIEPVLLRYAHVFHDEENNEFKGTDVIEYEIPISDTRPIRRPPYRTPYALREEMRTQVQKMLDQGIIRESNSPWSAPANLFPKKIQMGSRDTDFAWILEL